MAGIPNLIKTDLSTFLPTKKSLNRLLKKCTTPVSAIDTSTGKNNIIIGANRVPKPKPEKNVRIETLKATKEMIKISNIQ